MNTTIRWLVWIAAAALVIMGGVRHNWDTLHKILLAVIIVLGVLQLITPMFQRRMLEKIKALPPEEREKFLSRFDPRTQEKLKKQIEATDA